MNSAFQYWFDYIVRNGTFVEATASSVAVWEIQLDNGNTVRALTNVWDHIQVCTFLFGIKTPVKTYCTYCICVENNFDPNDSSLRPLISLRKII